MSKITKILLFSVVSLLTVLPNLTEATTASGSNSTATGGGRYLVAGVFDIQFGFAAIQHADGRVSGVFHHTTNDGLGSVDFDGRVTCLAVDKELGRAWIGGVIVTNRSTSPDFQLDIHQPGRDIWFRVLDGSKGHNSEVNRTTFVGFEGTIPSSEEYCDSRPWPADNARTWPVVKGNVSVH